MARGITWTDSGMARYVALAPRAGKSCACRPLRFIRSTTHSIHSLLSQRHCPSCRDRFSTARDDSPLSAKCGFACYVRITQHRQSLEYLTANEFLRQESSAFFLAVDQSGCTKARENQNPLQRMHPSHWMRRSKSHQLPDREY